MLLALGLPTWGWIVGGFLAILVVVAATIAIHDVFQKPHAILRNYPLVGHLRFLLERIGPELRQYVVASDTEERPFDRVQRSWVYASAKGQNNYGGFGTTADLETSSHYLIIQQSPNPVAQNTHPESDHDVLFPIPSAKVLGGPRDRKHAFVPSSIVNISAMSYGSMSGAAIRALNAGAAKTGCWQNTGEGGISPHHLQGGDLVWQLGTAYFGARTLDGKFDLKQLADRVAEHPVKAIEIKLSQGAKPGLGGLLPASKITPEIAAIRGIPEGQDCHSPPSHSEFSTPDELLDFAEKIADATGLPVGVKSAVGGAKFWEELARLTATTGRSLDFISIDGGEGGTGAAPVSFADHVSLPFKLAFSRAHQPFIEQGIDDRITWIGSGKLGFPDQALFAYGLGCDLVSIAREAMFAIGCIQALKCHTGHCPSGVATQNPRLERGLDPTLKADRVANYIATLRGELMRLAHACGVEHPSYVTLDDFEILDGHFGVRSAADVFRPPARDPHLNGHSARPVEYGQPLPPPAIRNTARLSE